MPTATALLAPDEQDEALRRLEERLRQDWPAIARPNQIAPKGDWAVWLILAGRGWGKTRTGAEFVADKARRHPGARIALVAQTFTDGRDTMVEGESGLLSVLGEHELRGGNRDDGWNRSMGELYLQNGSRFKVFSSEKPHRLRGPQHHFAWGDEPATWFDAHKGPKEDTTYSNLEIGCRLPLANGTPQIVLTGTPKPVLLLTRKDKRPFGLLHRDGVVLTRGHTQENIDNLDRTYRERIIEPLEGTRTARQELAAEILEDVEGALWRQAWIDDKRVYEPPYPGEWQQMPVVGVDPSDGTEEGAEHGLAVVALGMDHDLYVVESQGFRGVTPAAFAREAILTARRHNARIVIEKNHGGTWLEAVFRGEMRDMGVLVPLKMVVASKGKRVRAEPVAALAEQGRVHHIGTHDELEMQLTQFTGAPGEVSPDLLDAYVWAMSEYVGHSFKPPSYEEVHRYTDQPVAGVYRFH